MKKLDKRAFGEIQKTAAMAQDAGIRIPVEKPRPRNTQKCIKEVGKTWNKAGVQ